MRGAFDRESSPTGWLIEIGVREITEQLLLLRLLPSHVGPCDQRNANQEDDSDGTIEIPFVSSATVNAVDMEILHAAKYECDDYQNNADVKQSFAQFFLT
jgi:hypothetical protein